MLPTNVESVSITDTRAALENLLLIIHSFLLIIKVILPSMFVVNNLMIVKRVQVDGRALNSTITLSMLSITVHSILPFVELLIITL